MTGLAFPNPFSRSWGGSTLCRWFIGSFQNLWFLTRFNLQTHKLCHEMQYLQPESDCIYVEVKHLKWIYDSLNSARYFLNQSFHPSRIFNLSIHLLRLAGPAMLISTEALVTVLCLLVALPPSILVLCNVMRRRRRKQHSSNGNRLRPRQVSILTSKKKNQLCVAA